ncbi:MAG: hypothetical protein IJ937_08980 [Treponema sp.]|nr:hypothetical protein [Treponema sp.]
MKNKIAIFTVIFGLILSSSLSCKENKKVKIVASTSWVASIAELAGIDDVPTIAPVNLKHPPEYEIKPMDILKVSQADLFIYNIKFLLDLTKNLREAISNDTLQQFVTEFYAKYYKSHTLYNFG